MTRKAIWPGVKRFLSLRTLSDALWMDEPLYVILMMYFYPFEWSPFAVAVWLLGGVVTLQQLYMRTVWSLRVSMRRGASTTLESPLRLSHCWTRWVGGSDAPGVKDRSLVITPRRIPGLRCPVPARFAHWRIRWRKYWHRHVAQMKHAAWIALNLFDSQPVLSVRPSRRVSAAVRRRRLRQLRRAHQAQSRSQAR